MSKENFRHFFSYTNTGWGFFFCRKMSRFFENVISKMLKTVSKYKAQEIFNNREEIAEKT